MNFSPQAHGPYPGSWTNTRGLESFSRPITQHCLRHGPREQAPDPLVPHVTAVRSSIRRFKLTLPEHPDLRSLQVEIRFRTSQQHLLVGRKKQG